MPTIDGHEYSPAAAIEADYCPECGADLTKIDPHAHRLTHWMCEPPRGPDGDEGRKRRALYDAYLAAHAKSSEAPPPPPLRRGAAQFVTLTREVQS